MYPIKFKLLSRYPEFKQEGNKYYKLPRIIALRFQIKSIISITSIKITNNDKVVEETKISSPTKSTSQIKYFNIWINLGEQEFTKNTLKIYCKFFGIYVRVETINYLRIDANDINKYNESDSYIDVSILSKPALSGDKLVSEIIGLPSSMIPTCNSNVNKEICSILLLRIDQLGDFVLTMSAIYEIKQLFPQAMITGLVSPANQCIAKSSGLFDELITIQFFFEDKTNYRVLSAEAKNKVVKYTQDKYYDIAVDLSPMIESREILGLVNASRKFGFENTDTSMLDFGMLIHAKDPINSLSNVTHAAYPLLLVDAVKRIFKPVFYHAPRHNKSNTFLNELNLTSKNYIIIHSGARNLLVRWPLSNYIELTRSLSDHGINIVFFSDEKISQNDLKLLQSYNCKVIDQRIDFDDFDDIISNAFLFIGNDSGPKHLAAMRGVPTISIHSPRTNWSEWGQIDSGYILSRRVPCAGCAIVSKEECARDLQCINSISVGEVYITAMKLYTEISAINN